MRRRCMSIVLLGSLLLPATPARAEASGSHHLTARGLAASAFFSDRPSSGALPGVVYGARLLIFRRRRRRCLPPRAG